MSNFCQNCGTELNGAKFCPNCGKAAAEPENLQGALAEASEGAAASTPNAAQPPVKHGKKKNGCLIAILIVGVIGLLAIALNVLMPNPSSPPSVGQQQSEKLTLEKFEKIENGMSYNDVVGIIGCEGTLEAETGEKGTEYYTVSYRYMGDDQVSGMLGANASFMFQNGKLMMKAQLGLK